MLRAIARVGVNPIKIQLCRTVAKSGYSFRSLCSQAPNGSSLFDGRINHGNNKKRVCKYGSSCKFLKRGNCWFYHPEVEGRVAVPKGSDVSQVSSTSAKGGDYSGAPSNNTVKQAIHTNGNHDKTPSSAPPAAELEVEKWTTDKVLDWVNRVTGHSLLTLTEEKLMQDGFPRGPAASLALAIDGLKKHKDNAADTQRGQQLLTAILEGKFEVKEAKFTDSKGKEGSFTYIELADGLPWLLEESSILFERQCDKDLFDIISGIEKPGKALQGVVVTGNPGIGKSWFLIYLLYRFVLEKRTVVYQHSEEFQGWLFRSDGSVLAYKGNDPPPEVQTALRDPRTIFLFDPAGKEGPPKVNAFTVVSSPNPDNFRAFYKRVLNEFRMPCWKLTEIEAGASAIGMDMRKAIERFEKFGPIPRYIFHDNKSIDTKLKTAVDTCKLDELLSNLGKPEALETQSHKLFKYDVDTTNYMDYTVDFASLYVRGLLMNRLIKHEFPLLRAVGMSTKYYGAFGSLRGFLLETAMHHDIPLYGLKEEYALRNLETGKAPGCEGEKSWDFPRLPLEVVVLENNSLEGITLQKGCYYRPQTGNFGAVDSVVCYGDCAFGFQHTVSPTHAINYSELKKVVKATGVTTPSKFYFVFVVPNDNCGQFRMQQVKGAKIDPLFDVSQVAQFVLGLPYAQGTPMGEQLEQNK